MRQAASLVCVGMIAFSFAGNASKPARRSAFTEEQRAAIRRFWSDPRRYQVLSEPSPTGRYQARATVTGSQFFHRLRKGGVPAAVVDWANAKSAYDWAVARNDALAKSQAENARLKGTPEALPADPGPMPETDLADLVAPDRFAEVVTPRTHRITFPDVEYVVEDNVKMGDPRSAFYRNPRGIRRSGSPTARLSEADLRARAGQARIDDAGLRIMRAVSALEGGFDAINTYDTGIVSVGFIQFACLTVGKGSLAQALANMREIDPRAYDDCFTAYGIGLAPDGSLAAVDPVSGEEKWGGDAGQTIAAHPRLAVVFCRAAEKSPAFVAAQLKTAYDMYFPADDVATVTNGAISMRLRIRDIVRSEAGLATLMDAKVQTGKMAKLNAALSRIVQEFNCQTVDDIAKYERELVRLIRHRKDFLADTTLSQPPELPEGARRLALRRPRS